MADFRLSTTKEIPFNVVSSPVCKSPLFVFYMAEWCTALLLSTEPSSRSSGIGNGKLGPDLSLSDNTGNCQATVPSEYGGGGHMTYDVISM